MNPLAAIRQFMAPDFRSVQAPKTADTAPAGAVIPATDLKTLGTGAAGDVNPVSAGSVQGPFNSVLGQMVNEVNGKQVAASQAAQGVLSGQNVSLHQAVIAMEEASISFQLMVEVRNKLLDSYQELMRMQV